MCVTLHYWELISWEVDLDLMNVDFVGVDFMGMDQTLYLLEVLRPTVYLHRRKVYEILQRHGVEVPKYVVLNRPESESCKSCDVSCNVR